MNWVVEMNQELTSRGGEITSKYNQTPSYYEDGVMEWDEGNWANNL